MFAYCNNNPILLADSGGKIPYCADSPAGEAGRLFGEWLADQFIKRKNEVEQLKREENEMSFEAFDNGGGKVNNSYMLTKHRDIYEYAEELKQQYPENFKGSAVGIAFEWEVHNIACYIPGLDIMRAKDVDFGTTIFADPHPGMNVLMWTAYAIVHPYRFITDFVTACKE